MIADTVNTREYFAASAELLQLISSTDAKIINTVPFQGSWTAAQLAVHVTKSNKAIAQALEMEGEIAKRNPGERVGELRSMFLNFDNKFQSPEFIRPKKDTYQRDMLTGDLKNSIEHLREAADKAHLSEIISLPAFGEITKLELLHFVLYHTQRHVHQLKNILKKLQK